MPARIFHFLSPTWCPTGSVEVARCTLPARKWRQIGQRTLLLGRSGNIAFHQKKDDTLSRREQIPLPKRCVRHVGPRWSQAGGPPPLSDSPQLVGTYAWRAERQTRAGSSRLSPHGARTVIRSAQRDKSDPGKGCFAKDPGECGFHGTRERALFPTTRGRGVSSRGPGNWCCLKGPGKRAFSRDPGKWCFGQTLVT